MRGPERRETMADMEPEPLIQRSEVQGILFVIADIGVALTAIAKLLEEAIHGEGPEDDG